MRGKVAHRAEHHTAKRITPAYAGKSLPFKEYSLSFSGSPPPMRGKALRPDLVLFFCWITPAYAGKSRFHLNVS